MRRNLRLQTIVRPFGSDLIMIQNSDRQINNTPFFGSFGSFIRNQNNSFVSWRACHFRFLKTASMVTEGKQDVILKLNKRALLTEQIKKSKQEVCECERAKVGKKRGRLDAASDALERGRY
ncbi:hypothetical protein L596_015367 [Steinernema carpocapsae]|uniref:Uncharacterized protein n=1 Tax=Steinernema carpocapsae TaxID=34508 RepID=A0A4U5NER9_STECR|nr:hypothetical protein L596_015367 [Steinernema carpocapsae]